MLTTHLPDLKLDDPALHAVPARLIAIGEDIVDDLRRDGEGVRARDDDWDD